MRIVLSFLTRFLLRENLLPSPQEQSPHSRDTPADCETRHHRAWLHLFQR